MERDTFPFSKAWLCLEAGLPVTRQAWIDNPDQNSWDLVALVPFGPSTVYGQALVKQEPFVVMMLLRDGSVRGPLAEVAFDDVAAKDWHRVIPEEGQ